MFVCVRFVFITKILFLICYKERHTNDFKQYIFWIGAIISHFFISEVVNVYGVELYVVLITLYNRS